MSAKQKFNQNEPPGRHLFLDPNQTYKQQLASYLKGIKVWIRGVASIDGLTALGYNMSISCEAYDRPTSQLLDEILETPGATVPTRISTGSASSTSTALNLMGTATNESDADYLVRLRDWAKKTWVDPLENQRKPIDKNLLANYIAWYIWNYGFIVRKEGLSVKESKTGFVMLIKSGTKDAGMTLPDGFLGYRHWVSFPDSIITLANSEPPRKISALGNDPVKLRYSWIFQEIWIEEILNRGAVDNEHNRFEWIPSLDQGELVFTKGSLEKRIPCKEVQKAHAASTLDDALATCMQINEVELEELDSDSELVEQMRQIKQKFFKWKKQKELKNGKPDRRMYPKRESEDKKGERLQNDMNNGEWRGKPDTKPVATPVSRNDSHKPSNSSFNIQKKKALALELLKDIRGTKQTQGQKGQTKSQRARQSNVELDEDVDVEAALAELYEECIQIEQEDCRQLRKTDQIESLRKVQDITELIAMEKLRVSKIISQKDTVPYILMNADSECSFHMFVEDKVEPYIIHRWECTTVYKLADGGYLQGRERALVLVQVKLKDGPKARALLKGCLINDPGARDILLHCPQLDRFNGFATLPVVGKQKFLRVELEPSTLGKYPFSTVIRGEKVERNEVLRQAQIAYPLETEKGWQIFKSHVGHAFASMPLLRSSWKEQGEKALLSIPTSIVKKTLELSPTYQLVTAKKYAYAERQHPPTSFLEEGWGDYMFETDIGKVIFSVIDAKTSLVEAQVVPSRAGEKALPVINKFHAEWGAFKIFRCDNELSLTHGVVAGVLRSKGTHIVPFEKSSSRGPCERWHQSLRRGIQHFFSVFGFPVLSFFFVVMMVVYSHNITSTSKGRSPIHAATGVAPVIRFLPGEPVVYVPQDVKKTLLPRGSLGVFGVALSTSECVLFRWDIKKQKWGGVTKIGLPSVSKAHFAVVRASGLLRHIIRRTYIAEPLQPLANHETESTDETPVYPKFESSLVELPYGPESVNIKKEESEGGNVGTQEQREGGGLVTMEDMDEDEFFYDAEEGDIEIEEKKAKKKPYWEISEENITEGKRERKEVQRYQPHDVRRMAAQEAEGTTKTSKKGKWRDVREGKYDNAALDELQRFQECEVLGDELKENEYFRPEWVIIPLMWVLAFKTAVQKFKARLVVIGNSIFDRRVVDTYAGTPHITSLRILFILSLTKCWKFFTSDIKTAFLQVPYDDRLGNLGVRMPKWLPPNTFERFGWKEGKVYKLLKVLYGLKDAPRVFGQWLKKHFWKKGFKEMSESFHVRSNKPVPELVLENEMTSVAGVEGIEPTEVIHHHVDDLNATGEKVEETLLDLQKQIFMDPHKELDAESRKILGFDCRREKGTIYQSMCSYLTLDELPPGKKSGVVVESDFTPPRAEEIDMTLEGSYRKYAGVLQWMSTSRWDLAFAASVLASFSNTPSAHLLLVIVTLLRLAAQYPLELRFVGIHGNAELRLHLDAGFTASQSTCRSAYVAQLAQEDWKITDIRNILCWATKREGRKVLSAPAAELLAWRFGLKAVPLVLRNCRLLFGRVKLIICTDSTTVMAQVINGVSSKEQGLQGVLSWVKQEYESLGAEMIHVRSEDQLADRLTKWKGLIR